MFHCERCGRQAGLPMLACPERQLGSCIYTLQRKRSGSSGGRILLAVGIVSLLCDLILLIFMLFELRHTMPIAGRLVTAIMLLGFSALILAFGTYLTVGEQLTLYNAETGQMWQRRSLGKLEIRWSAVSQLEPLPLEACLNLSHNWPASLSALVAETPSLAGLETPATRSGVSAMISAIARNPAAYLFEAALLGLLADQRLRLRRGLVERSYFGRSAKQVTEYFVQPGEVSWQNTEGWLEQGIILTVHRWWQHKEAHQWLQGVPVYELVRALYPRNQSNPGGWLIRQVQEDTVSAV